MNKHTLQNLLLPFSLLYGAGVWLRNKMYDTGLLHSQSYSIPIICVGNVAAGGTGKTPVTAYLVQLLQHYKVAVLSRGYGRKTRGFILAGPNTAAHDIGDEPLQLYKQFKGKVTVAVAENRHLGIQRLQQHHDVIIMDDGMQHRAVQPGLTIALFTRDMVVKPDNLLPAGRLRDTYKSACRAQVFIITKSECETGLPERLYTLCGCSRPTFTSHIAYAAQLQPLYGGAPVPLANLQGTQVALLTGIANSLPLVNFLSRHCAGIQHYSFADHFNYTPQHLAAPAAWLKQAAAQPRILVTTEKDAARLANDALKAVLLGLPVYYLPVSAQFCAGSAAFDNLILQYVKGTAGNS